MRKCDLPASPVLRSCAPPPITVGVKAAPCRGSQVAVMLHRQEVTCKPCLESLLPTWCLDPQVRGAWAWLIVHMDTAPSVI